MLEIYCHSVTLSLVIARQSFIMLSLSMTCCMRSKNQSFLCHDHSHFLNCVA